MKTCLKCNVTINDHTAVCPLCHGGLTGEVDFGENNYPEVTKRRQKMKHTVRILWLASVVAYAVMRILAVKLQFDKAWDVLVGGCLLYLLFTFHVSFLGRRGYQFRMIMQTIGALLLVVLVDVVLGFYGWSLNFVVPGVFVLVDVAVLILMLANGRNWQSYIPIQLLVVALSFISVLLYMLNITNEWYPAFGGFVIVCVIFLATVLVGGNRAIQEIRRRFHI